VAIEPTGVYWIHLYDVLEKRGFRVVLGYASTTRSQARHNKTDVKDCEWLQTLHTHGLIDPAFVPDGATRALRTLLRHRQELIETAASRIQLMIKSLASMNIRLDTAVTDITGVTGMAIISSILEGERDPAVLASMRDKRCAKTAAEIEQALFGHYKDEHLLELRHAVESWRLFQRQLATCDADIESQLLRFPQQAPREAAPKARRQERIRKNVPRLQDGRSLLYSICGEDLTQIDGLSVSTVLTVIAETGVDMARWPTDRHFGAWIGLAPDPRRSGGKKLRTHRKRKPGRAATALRLAAQALDRSQCALGAFYRRIKSRRGPAVATTATAYKLARMIYMVLNKKCRYVDPGTEYRLEADRPRILRNLQKRALSLGYQLQPNSA
jgi:transposase